MTLIKELEILDDLLSTLGPPRKIYSICSIVAAFTLTSNNLEMRSIIVDKFSQSPLRPTTCRR